MAVCKIEDDFLIEKLRWVVTLSNGEKIYQDDDRPGEEEPKAWLRLKQYIQDKNVSIVKFEIQFCSHVEEAAPPNSEGYYFVQKVDAVAFSGDINSTYKYYIIGHLLDGKIYTTHWMVPEIIRVGNDVRDFIEDDQKLIVNPKPLTIIDYGKTTE